MDAQTFFDIAVIGSYFFLTAACFIGFIRFKSLGNDQLILLLLLAISVAVELVGRILWKFSLGNLFLYHFYSIAEFTLLGTLYKRNLTGVVKSVYSTSIIALFIIFAVVNTIFFQRLKEFNSNVTFAESLLLIVWALLYFYKLLRDMEHRQLQRVPMFWINMSVLTYFSGAFLLFHVANELFTFPKEEIAILWGTHALFNIVHYFLYGIALWVKPEGFPISKDSTS